MTTERVTRGHGVLEEFLARKRANVANRLIPAHARNGSILDIGCGSFPLFLTTTPFALKFGLDRLTDERIRERFQAQGIDVRNGDLEQLVNLPFDDDLFDVVTMLAVLEHLTPDRLVSLVREIRRVLKPGAIFILTTPASWTRFILNALVVMHLVSKEEIDEHKDAYSRGRIRDILLRAGFDSARIRSGSFECGMNIWAAAEKSA